LATASSGAVSPENVEVLGPEIDRLLVGAHEVVGHLPERRRAEGADVERQPLNPADDQQRSIFDVVVGVVMGDEDRLERVEGNAGSRVLVGDAHAAIEHIGRAVAQHDVRGHHPRAAGHGVGGGAEHHQLGALGVLQRGLRLLRRPARPGCLRNTLFRQSRDDRGRRQTGQQAAARKP
jgi:hypothetical protein